MKNLLSATAVAEDSQPQRDGTVGVPQMVGAHDTSEQMQHVFHELHAEGRHGLCEVCANQ